MLAKRTGNRSPVTATHVPHYFQTDPILKKGFRHLARCNHWFRARLESAMLTLNFFTVRRNPTNNR
jgi:hypothetical protein